MSSAPIVQRSSAASTSARTLLSRFRPLGRPVVWTPSGGSRPAARGWLLQSGVLFDPLLAHWPAGTELNGLLEYEEGPAGDFGDHGPLKIELASPRFGAWGAFDRHRVDAPAFAAEGAATAAWIRDAMGESEFRWDTLAVERSMLRLMVGVLAFDPRQARFRFCRALLDSSPGVSPDARDTAAAMAEFDGQGKRLSNDFYFHRTEQDGSAGPRAAIYPHLLLNCGRFLCNYKRRFLIQNALELSVERRLELHRDLLILDLTEDAKRAVRLDWTKLEDRRSVPMDRFFENETSNLFVEEFGASLRLWRQLALPSADQYEEAVLACLGVSRCLANAREAGLLARAAAAAADASHADRLALVERMNRPLTMFSVARGQAAPDAAAAEWREFAEFIALRAEEYEEDARMALGAVSDPALAEALERLFDEIHFAEARALYAPLESAEEAAPAAAGEDLFHV